MKNEKEVKVARSGKVLNSVPGVQGGLKSPPESYTKKMKMVTVREWSLQGNGRRREKVNARKEESSLCVKSDANVEVVVFGGRKAEP